VFVEEAKGSLGDVCRKPRSVAKLDHIYEQAKFNDILRRWFEYRHDKHDADQWEPPVKFSDNDPVNDANFFTKEERSKLYNASLEYKTPPAYDNQTPEEQDRWKAHIAQMLKKPKEQVRSSDFKELRKSWKFPSLIGCTLDGALQPLEIERSEMSWLRLEKRVEE